MELNEKVIMYFCFYQILPTGLKILDLSKKLGNFPAQFDEKHYISLIFAIFICGYFCSSRYLNILNLIFLKLNEDTL